MKKLGLAVLSLIFCVQFAQGQDYNKYKFGFKVNPDISWMTPKDNHLESMGVVTRFGFGFISDIHFTENYAFGTGVNLERSGGILKYYDYYQFEDQKHVLEKERKYNLQYIEIPVSFKMRTNEIGFITYYGQFGVGLGLNIDARADDKNTYVSTYNDETGEWDPSSQQGFDEENRNISNEIEIGRASLLLAAGIEYNLSGSTSLVAGITYNNGFTNVLKGSAVGTTNGGQPNVSGSEPELIDLNATNSFIAINIGLLF